MRNDDDGLTSCRLTKGRLKITSETGSEGHAGRIHNVISTTAATNVVFDFLHVLPAQCHLHTQEMDDETTTF